MNAQEIWQADFAKVSKVVEPYTLTHPSGVYVSTSAPESLRNLYSNLTAIGYANGWL